MVPFDVVSFWAGVCGLACVVGGALILDNSFRVPSDYQRGLGHGIAFVGALLAAFALIGWALIHVRFI